MIIYEIKNFFSYCVVDSEKYFDSECKLLKNSKIIESLLFMFKLANGISIGLNFILFLKLLKSTVVFKNQVLGPILEYFMLK